MKLLALTAATLVAITSLPASAQSLTGSTVTATLLYPTTTQVYAGPVTTTVGNQVEFPFGSFAPAVGSFDIDANTITFFSNQNGNYGTTSGANAFNGYRLDFAGRTITSLTLAAGTTYTPNSFNFSGSSIFFDVSGQDPAGGQTVFAVGVAAVPEPATWGLMILGFGAMGFALRRRSATRTTVSFA